MKVYVFVMAVLITGFVTSCRQGGEKGRQQQDAKNNNEWMGRWIKMGHSGPVGFLFKENGVVEGDFGDDGTIDIRSEYKLAGDTIIFHDESGQMCQEEGFYTVDQNRYYLAFDLVEDNCNGRIKTTLGCWTRPDHEELLEELQEEIKGSNAATLYLNRARIYLALGNSEQARQDLDAYIKQDSSNPRAYINRAATGFPFDMEEVVRDCNKAIALDPQQKNAYFLRGMALYELGEKQQGCEDFEKAIELGFSVLRIAEQQKCAEYWDE